MKVIKFIFVLIMILNFIVTPSFQESNKAEASSSAFKIAVLPDTQNLASKHPEIFRAQTQWIAENSKEQNIKFVVHEGDITNNNNTSQWEVAYDAMQTLDEVVPYTVLPGNHDIGTGGSANTRDTTLYNTYFPVSNFSGTETFGGVYSEEPDKYDNNYHTFNAGGTDWLVLSLEFGPRDPVLDWANEVVSSHPNHRVIVVTHSYMFSDETRHNTGHAWNAHNYGVASEIGGVNDGEEMWQKFVKLHPNISMVLSGHVLNDGQGRRVSVGDYGNKVYQMLSNYQMQANGGNGFIRLLDIDPEAGTIKATSYSPYLDEYKTDWQNEFQYTNVELGAPNSDVKKPRYLFSNDFSEEKNRADDGLMKDWTIVDEGTIDAPSKWSVAEGEVVQSSNIYGPNVPAVDNRKGTFAYYDKHSAFNWGDYTFSATLNATDNDGIGLMFRYQDPDNYYKLELDNQRKFSKLFKVVDGKETTLAHMAEPGYIPGTKFELEIKVSGNQIQVFRDGIDIFGEPIIDNSHSKGTVALYSWGNQSNYFDDVLVKDVINSSHLLEDDFSKDNQRINDGPMNDWTIVDEGTIEAPSKWSVVRGEVVQSSNIYGPNVPAFDNRKGTFAYYDKSGSFSWKDYSFSSTIRSTDNDGIGLMFRYQDPDNYYKLELDNEQNFYKLFKVVDGIETTLSHLAKPGYTQGANFELEVKVIGNQIQAFQDGINIFGKPIVDHSHSKGTIALYAWGNPNSYFDDVLVKREHRLNR
ncbi:metallophosphoesterase [Mesobacillus foraminis]|uniref:3',5'-cyclic AMP phosphodiesterase CpdA n=1 Tax=Mesobacillus foraminis TaxID=279826 RepID=A0A4R2AUG8_9BACI|nr:metallophosphoesterase [Mesobacillus foraminis]TCN17548.1 3',5'-cyclic AMP phosphodiesterase CpdA [Mesobacillus foraminis]